MTWTVDYTRTVAGKWTGRLRAHDHPDTTIDTREHEDFLSAADEVYELVGDGDTVYLGDVTEACEPDIVNAPGGVA